MRRSRMITILFTGAIALSSVAVQAQDNQDTYDDVSAEVAVLRELELLDPINVRVMSRAELQEQQASDLETDYPAQDREDDRRVLVAFGLIDEDDDLGQIYVDLLGEQVAGYYDPTTDEMVVVASSDSDGLSASDTATFAHEVVHALQDQHFDLETYSDLRIEGTSDESLAVTALIEGDATQGQLDFLIANPSLARDYLDEAGEAEGDMDVFDSAPPILTDTLIFPYIEGQAFVQELYDDGGWTAVDEAYADPPTTTEQILHPEKYLDGEEALAVEVPDLEAALGSGWSTIDDDTMGELQTRILLEESDLRSSQSARAAEGWGGDSYTVCVSDDEVVVAWATAWDSEDDAEEFAQALIIRESERFDADVEEDGDTVTLEGDGAVVQIVREDSSVTYIQAPDTETLDRVADQIT